MWIFLILFTLRLKIVDRTLAYFDELKKMPDEMAEERIYVNSYMMKTTGDDTQFEVDLGGQYTFDEI